MEILNNPFAIGLGIGLVAGLIIAIYVAISGATKRRTLIKDNRTLREHLHTQMTINAEGNKASLAEIEQLKKQNENLRISVATLKSKPEKADQKALYIYDRAIHIMNERAPGFAPAWESALKDANEEMDKTSTGIIPWLKKRIWPSLSAGPLRASLSGPQTESAVRSVEKQDQRI